MKELVFNKENGAWYIDLPDWKGSKADLLMVCGADSLLDIISDHGEKVELTASETPFPRSSHLALSRLGESEGGAFYTIKSFGERRLDMEIWLCDVVKYVFEGVPQNIYFKAKK